MEAAPRLPMLSFDLKICTENTQFAPQLKQYIAAFYNEDPDSYLTEIHNLEVLRAGAVRPSMDIAGVQLLKKYYCQLHFLKSRFPMEENQDAAIQFSWKDPQLDISYSCNDIRFELMVIMYNIGALHSYLGANDSRSSPDGMKMACTHFQCAAWAFQTVKETYHQFVMYISLIELVHFFQQVCLAQAQECILEKSMLDNRKANIIAKVAVQVNAYYRQSLKMLESCSEDLFRDKTYKEWTKFLQFKLAYYKCVALLFQGQQAEEQQKMGERVAFYQAACEQLEEAKKWAAQLKNRQSEINEGLAFTQDVVEGKRKAAKNENEFIYHEEVPSKENLQEVKGAPLVKGIAFSINDVEVSGPDIFARLIPMEAHEAASLYSEKKAQMLRSIGELIESKDQALAEFMSSMQLDMLTKMHQATGIPQEIIDRAAALSAKPSATQELIDVMGKLSGIYQDVESNLKEIDSLLKEEEEAEKSYQEIMGKRPPSIIATDLSREAAKYKEAHNKANDSNQTLHKAMMAHVANLKLLQQPLRQLQQQLPAIEMPNPNIDENSLKELETLVSKVEEMRNQRAMLWAQLREAVHKDDITNSLVTKQPNQSLEQLFQQELQKHEQLKDLIEKNALAQENIKKALVDSYAKAITTRRYIQDMIQKRNSTISALITSYDSYDDLLAKANKGIEFYTKLENNVSKLLQRIKSACKVQQEEREQMLLKNDAGGVVPKFDDPTVNTQAPKLKDYLESRRQTNQTATYPNPNLSYQQHNINYNPTSTDMTVPGVGVRPTPLGSEVTDMPAKSAAGAEPGSNYQYNYHMYHQYQQPAAVGNAANVDQDLAKRMTNVYSNNSKNDYNASGAQYSSYTSYIPQNYTPTSYPYSTQAQVFSQNDTTATSSSYDPSKAYTTTTNSYKLQTSTLPNSTNTHMQYPDSGNNQQSYIPVSQSSSVNTAQIPQHNINTYYPTGYAPDYSNPVQGHSDGQAQYHSLEYATSVQPNIAVNYNNYNSTYSSPIANLTSAQATNMATNVSEYAGTSYPNSLSYSTGTTSAPVSNVTTSYVTAGSSYSYPYSSTAGYNQYGGESTGTVYGANYGVYAATANNASLGQEGTSTNFGTSTYGTATSGTVPQQGTSTNYGTGNSAAPALQPYGSNTSLSYPGTSQQPQQYNNTTGAVASSSISQQNLSYGGGPAQAPSVQESGSNQSLAYGHYPNYNTGYYQNYGYNYASADTVATTTASTALPATTKSSNIDLLSGLDFTISQAPLIPQQKVVEQKEENLNKSISKTSKDEPSPAAVVPAPEVKRATVAIKILPSKPLNNNDVKQLFNQEIEKYEKYVETLTNKTLSGPTNLDIKWKEIQDKQDGEKKIISVARCYPMKNRFPDILPYDHSRIVLQETKDDYINASLIKDVSLYAPAFIVTQTPLSSTISEFWTMIREQQVELIFCLINDTEIGDDVYWPREKGQQLHCLNMVITLQSVIIKSHWIERLISVSVPEKRESWAVMHLQFTSWPGSLFPTSSEPFVSFVLELISLYQQQRNNMHPIVVHCASGIGRSGLMCLLTAAIYDVTNNANSIPDLTMIASKLINYKKNILRDREHLKFAYECFLAYMRQVLNQDKMKKKLNEVVPPKMELEVNSQPVSTSAEEVNEKNIDPLSTLDPFWASKK